MCELRVADLKLNCQWRAIGSETAQSRCPGPVGSLTVISDASSLGASPSQANARAACKYAAVTVPAPGWSWHWQIQPGQLGLGDGGMSTAIMMVVPVRPRPREPGGSLSAGPAKASGRC